MIRILFFMSKPESWTASQFQEHYETHHAPLVKQIPPEDRPVIYQRRFLDTSSPVLPGPAAQYDLMMEMGFRDEAHYKQFEMFVLDDGLGSEIYEEKAKFQRMEMLTIMRVKKFEDA